MKLKVEPADGPEFERTIDNESLVIGRASSSDLALADPFLSRHHARLYREGADLMVEDLGSRNGTEVNGRAITGPTRVRAGDTLRVSGSHIRLVDETEAKTVEPSTESDLFSTIFRPAAELIREVETDTSQVGVGTEELRRYADRLRLLNDIHEALGRSMEIDDLLHLILERAFEHLQPENGTIFLREDEGFRRAASRPLEAENEIPLSTHLVEEVCDKGMAALVLDAATDARFEHAQSIIMSGMRSVLAAPLLDQDRSLGMIVLSSSAAVRQFQEEDMELLASLASVAALKIRNAALAEEAVARRRLEEDLALARRIQESLLPPGLPDWQGFELYAINQPSRGVSGDWYMISVREGDELVLLCADVSGKGIGAALLTASMEALSAAPIESGSPPDEICTQLCRRLHRRSPPEKYATAFLAVIDADRERLTYTNAGHNPALVARANGEVEELQASGMPIGLIADAEYTRSEVRLGSGDLFMIYTDGLSEAEDPDEEQYGEERLIEFTRDHRTLPLNDFAEKLHNEIESFTHNAPPTDDRTLLLARKT
ncbi:MAG: SpoIIE family protein phosphatase [Acidobacteriota bacterium]